MSETVARVTQLIRNSDRVDWGRECGALLAEAITLADAAGEEQLAYAARMRQVSNAHMMDDSELVLATFAVCEDAHRRDPLRFPADPGQMRLKGLRYEFADLHWMWKWIPSILMDHPRFSRADVEAALADMGETYTIAGQGTKALAERQLDWALELGDDAAIRQWREASAALPHDANADCEACSRGTLILAALHLGEVDDAIRLLDEIIAGEFECAEEPAVTLSHMLPTLARAGREDAVRAGVGAVLDNQEVLNANVGAAGRLASFLTQSGQAGRGLVVARRALPLMAERPLGGGWQIALLTGLAVVCDELVRQGLGEWAVPQADEPALRPWLATPTPHTVASLGPIAEEAAWRLAREFDTRNRTDHQSSALASALTSGRTERFDIALTLPPEPAAAFLGTDDDLGLLFRLGNAPVPVPADAQHALSIATELSRGGRHEEAIDVARHWLPRLEDPTARAAMVYRLSAALAALPAETGVDPDALAEDLRAAVAPIWPEAADMLVDLGRLALLPLDPREAASAVDLVQRWVAEGRSDEAIGFGAAFLASDLGLLPPERLRTWGDAALEGWQRLGRQPAWWCLKRAPLLTRSAAHDTGQLEASEVDALLTPALLDASGMDAAALWAMRVDIAEDPATAADAALSSYRHAVPWADAEMRASLAIRLLSACAGAERLSEVLAVASFLRQIAPSLAPVDGANALRAAASGLLLVNQFVDAAEVADEALAAASIAVDPPLALVAAAHGLRGEAARRLGDSRVAIDHLLQSADLWVSAGEPLAAADAALDAAFIHLDLGSPSHAGEIVESVLGLVDDQPDAWSQRLRAQHAFALAASRIGDLAPPETVEAAFDAALALASAPPSEELTTWAASVVDELRRDKARWLTYRGRHDEARALKDLPHPGKDT